MWEGRGDEIHDDRINSPLVPLFFALSVNGAQTLHVFAVILVSISVCSVSKIIRIFSKLTIKGILKFEGRNLNQN
jgi:hypothetical protein